MENENWTPQIFLFVFFVPVFAIICGVWFGYVISHDRMFPSEIIEIVAHIESWF
jgi:hypothetical protein